MVRFFSSSPCQIFLYSMLFFSVSPYSFLGRLFFCKRKITVRNSRSNKIKQ
nr:MAG TPA: hypothetical protein [Caudoviricetes sp.]